MEQKGQIAKNTRVLQVTPDAPEPERIEQAARALRSGGLVAFPTETVYGLGANALDEAAVEEIFRAKGRPSSDPLIVHLASVDELGLVASDTPREVRRLARHFWPGPLTLVLPRAGIVPRLVTAGLNSVGVRVPSHPVALALIRAAKVPVAAPSANQFGRTSPTRAEHVLEDLAGRIDLLLDAGQTTVGVESTVLDLSGDRPRLLRPGGIPTESLERVLGRRVLVGGAEGPARAPGQMLRHYAPRARLEVLEGPRDAVLSALAARARAAVQAGKRVGLLLADEDVQAVLSPDIAESTLLETLGSRDDLAGIARRLYAAMRALDAERPDLILSGSFGSGGLGEAIADRLRRAAEGRVTRIAEKDRDAKPHNH